MAELQLTPKSTSISVKGSSFSIDYVESIIGNTNYTVSNLPELSDIKINTQKEVLIIDSVNSGIGRENRDFYDTVLKPLFNQLQIKHDYLKTDSKDSISESSKSIKDNSLVVLLSGDTSIFELINNVSSSINITLFPFPLGTGNGIANAIGLTDEFIALQALLTFLTTNDLKIDRLPIYKVEFPEGSNPIFDPTKQVDSLLFTVVFSWATHADIVYLSESPDLRLLGLQRFQIAARESMMSHKKYNGEFSPSELSHIKSHNYLIVVAVSNFEKTYKISPESNIFKNELHLLDAGGVDESSTLSIEELGAFSLKPYEDGAHVKNITDDRIVYKKISDREIFLTLTDDNEDNSHFCVDGISIKVKNPKGKSIKVSYLDDDQVVNIQIPNLK